MILGGQDGLVNVLGVILGVAAATQDARIVIASVDTYLRFAEAVGRLDLTQNGSKGLPELVEDIT